VSAWICIGKNKGIRDILTTGVDCTHSSPIIARLPDLCLSPQPIPVSPSAQFQRSQPVGRLPMRPDTLSSLPFPEHLFHQTINRTQDKEPQQ
jgi:hypothetical protein